MQIEEHRWWSDHLNRDMALKIYGHWGKPFIVFPSSRGRYFDYEGMGMIEAIEDTRSLDFLFREKSVPACVDYWGHDVNHDWAWWYKQMNHFLGSLYS